MTVWYSEHEPKSLDFSKPIIAERDGLQFLLLPRIGRYSFRVIGYGWFNLGEGEWNSCTIWPTPQEAIAAYNNCTFRNAEIIVK